MTLIHLVRHGAHAAEGCLIGRTDAPLTEAGRQQFARQTSGLACNSVVASPLRRARVSAEGLAGARGLPLRIDEDWAELCFGDWDGRVLAELNADPATADRLVAIYRSAESAAAPGGEDWYTLQARVGRALDRLVDPGPGSRLLVVTHAGPMRAALALVCGMPFVSLWAFRIAFGTRITLRTGRDANAGLWGEIVEVVQP